MTYRLARDWRLLPRYYERDYWRRDFSWVRMRVFSYVYMEIVIRMRFLNDIVIGREFKHKYRNCWNSIVWSKDIFLNERVSSILYYTESVKI